MAAPVGAKAAIHVAQSKTGRRVIGGILAGVLVLLMSPFLLAGTVFMGAVQSAEEEESGCTSLEVDGYSDVQLKNAETILSVADELEIPEKGKQIALAVALVESELRNLANTTVAASMKLENDGTGSNADSVGVFQQRPSAGWGSVEELMDVEYATKAFFGGDDGPNGGSPAGLRDIPGWNRLPAGTAAQRVQVSATPDAYEPRLEDAQEIMDGDTGAGCSSGGSGELVGDLAYPVPKGTPAGTYAGHHGVDFPPPEGTPIYAIADGTVSYAGRESWGARVIFIRHANGVVTQYAHMHEGASGVLVKTGDKVKAGDKIGEVGSSGNSTGAHLHFEVELDVPEGQTQPYNSTTAPYRWLKKHKIAPGKLYEECGNCGTPELEDDFAYSGAYSR